MAERSPSAPLRRAAPIWAAYLAVFGATLTLQGYRSRDGDQAYRLPLLLHRQDESLYAHDPFVQAVEAFNPHGGFLGLLDGASRWIGLSASLFLLYAATFALMSIGLRRLARAVWPDGGEAVGLVALGMVLIADAGNIGTNHLFGPMLLDRLIAFALGWIALADYVEGRAGWRSAWPIFIASLVHPSIGLQLGMLLMAAWGLKRDRPQRRHALSSLAGLGLAVAPSVALAATQGSTIFEGLDPRTFRLLSFQIQGPQHMLPSLWRAGQWAAWFAYPALAGLTVWRWWNQRSTARDKTQFLINLLLIGLLAGWIGIEILEHPKITLFQPFRMATIVRGLCLVVLSGWVWRLVASGNSLEALRAGVIVAGLGGDGAFVVAALAEVSRCAAEALRHRCNRLKRRGAGSETLSGSAVSRHQKRFGIGWLGSRLQDPGGAPARPRATRTKIALATPKSQLSDGFSRPIYVATLVLGIVWLARNDPDEGHLPLLLGIAGAGILQAARRFRGSFAWTIGRAIRLNALAWAVPVLALAGAVLPARGPDDWRLLRSELISRCRFAETPIDDLERLAVWCREQTPRDARFIGPPGAKTFRLWSRRELAFNRASSPYHAAGLADWAARFADHVGYSGSIAGFADAYLTDRHRLERRYDEWSDKELAALAERQGAQYVITQAHEQFLSDAEGSTGETEARSSRPPLALLRVEGRYAVYRVRNAACPRRPGVTADD